MLFQPRDRVYFAPMGVGTVIEADVLVTVVLFDDRLVDHDRDGYTRVATRRLEMVEPARVMEEVYGSAEG